MKRIENLILIILQKKSQKFTSFNCETPESHCKGVFVQVLSCLARFCARSNKMTENNTTQQIKKGKNSTQQQKSTYTIYKTIRMPRTLCCLESISGKWLHELRTKRTYCRWWPSFLLTLPSTRYELQRYIRKLLRHHGRPVKEDIIKRLNWINKKKRTH